MRWISKQQSNSIIESASQPGESLQRRRGEDRQQQRQQNNHNKVNAIRRRIATKMSKNKRPPRSHNNDSTNSTSGSSWEHQQESNRSGSGSSWMSNTSGRPPRSPVEPDNDLIVSGQQHQQKQLPTSSATNRPAHANQRGASLLHRKTPSLSSHQTTPISKHYELNHQILVAFESLYSNKVYRIAYAMGMQFVETALLEIPKHGYYYSQRHERERMQSSLEAVHVTQLLKQLIEEEQDVVKDLADQQRVEKLVDLAIAQVEQASEDQYEGQRAEAEAELRSYDGGGGGGGGTGTTDVDHHQNDFVLCEPMLVAYDSLTNVLCPSAGAAAATATATPIVQQQQQQAVLPSSQTTAAGVAESSLPTISADVIHQETGVPLADRIRSAPAWGPERWQAPTTALQEEPPPPPPATMRTSATSSTGSVVPPPPLLIRSALEEEESGGTGGGGGAGGGTINMNAPISSSSIFDPSTTSLNFSNVIPEDLMLEKALYLSGLEVTPTVSMDYGEASARGEYKYDDDNHERVGPPPEAQQPSSFPPPSYEEAVPAPPTPLEATVSTSVLQLETLARFYHEDFDHLRSSGQIRISYADNTYQGRIPESTNGCTVIAPLLCIHHLFEDPDQIPDPSLTDGLIEQVIDVESPAILQELRTKLGLSAQAFLIPSDAHDFLIENGQLCQEQFISVIGGNILNENHLQAFISALEDKKNDGVDDNISSSTRRRKVAACWFFHEHVVAILKVRRDHNDTCWYDVIDGLPLKQTLALVGETDEQFTSRIGLSESQEFLSDAFLPKTARIRCLSAQALTACLRWYACSKFTADDVSYIDQYPWHDRSCDFDPRVFQGFIWGSMT